MEDHKIKRVYAAYNTKLGKYQCGDERLFPLYVTKWGAKTAVDRFMYHYPGKFQREDFEVHTLDMVVKDSCPATKEYCRE